MRRTLNPSLILALACTLAVASTATATHGADWQWLAPFSDRTSSDLQALHEELHAVHSTLAGIPVSDLTWAEELFELRMESGVLYPEPPVRGATVGAFFVGKGTVSFTPKTRKGRDDLRDFYSREAIESEPVTYAYIFSLRAAPVAEVLGLTDAPTLPLQDRATYEMCKQAFRQMGTRPLYSFLNREGRSKDTGLVLFQPQAIRAGGGPGAHLLYRFDPGESFEVALQRFGHKETEPNTLHRYYFRSLLYENHKKYSGIQARATRYSNTISIVRNREESTEKTVITLQPRAGLHGLRLNLVPWLEVQRVTGCGGEELEFAQWKHMLREPDYDQHLIIAFPTPPATGKDCELTVESTGTLGLEEDDWFPRVADDLEDAHFELKADIRKGETVLGPGRLLSEETRDGRTYFQYETTTPHKRSTIYYGDLHKKTEKVDETLLEIYVQADDINERQNHDWVLTEVANAVKVFNRLLVPMKPDVLRVVSTHAHHGRGFEGLILLGRGGFWGNESSSSDTFRAHEVAHQWWGNMVRPESWPRDRWLSEAFAEFCAMEYYSVRFQDEKKTTEHIRKEWVRRELFTTDQAYKDLAGAKVKLAKLENFPIDDGGNNVYTKGPLILHMLRYIFYLQKESDEPFWAMLRQFLTDYSYKMASTDDFIEVVHKHLGAPIDWFWDQWIRGRWIPEVEWSYSVDRRDSGWLVTVNVEQTQDFKLVIPVYFQMGKHVMSRPLVVQGRSGSRQFLLPEEPSKVTLNQGYEALIAVKE